MATYVLGDIHGCFETLRALLNRIAHDPERDRLWLVGDLVNGGPSSLQTLRWARGLGPGAVTVLGNHDLYLLARACGAVQKKSRDTLEAVLAAPDRDVLIDWLRRRPVIHRDGDVTLVHAGLLPHWTLQQAESLGQAISRELSGDGWSGFLASLFRKKRESCRPRPSLECALQAMSTLRTCRSDSRMCLGFSGPPEQAPKGCRAWYDWPASLARPGLIYFGHWAALGYRRLPNVVGLDSGCRWGDRLTALRLEDGRVFQQESLDAVQ